MKSNITIWFAACCLFYISCDDDDNNPKRSFRKGLGVTDIDGNKYETIILLEGDRAQEWMTSNLKTSRYSNGDPIPNVTDDNWTDIKIGAWCNYNNDPSLDAVYGKLYNGYAAGDPRGLCPTGWHFPSSFELYQLATDFGGEEVGGGAMKAEGTNNWVEPNADATDRTGLSILPGGYRNGYIYDYFDKAGRLGRYWSGGDHMGGSDFYELSNENSKLVKGTYPSGFGFSCRCVKD